MTDTEVLEKYGSIKLEFEKCYRHSFTYVSSNGKYKVHGLADYRSDFSKIMTVGDLWNELQTFNFELLTTNPK